MALQGNLRDFSVSEILQLLGTQRKTGCLQLRRDKEAHVVFVTEGRVVSAREPGMRPEDPLLRLLIKVRRLSTEQERGLAALHQESGRDLEDLLLNGKYLEQDDLASCIERQVLEVLTLLSHWESGTYNFDPSQTWKGAKLIKLSAEGALIEAARRIDEGKRQRAMFGDSHQLLGVRDLPDPDEPLADEEREMFGLVDGQHTVAEIVEIAPLTDYESYEALQRMMESGWVEFVGRREPGKVAPAAEPPSRRAASLAREAIAVAIGILALVAPLLGARFVPPPAPAAVADDVFVAARIRDVRTILELYRRERGVYPERLAELVEDHWLSASSLVVPEHAIRYQRLDEGADYRIQLEPVR